MDDYPKGSLDHNVPLLMTLGLPSSEPGEDPLPLDLREQATLLRSEIPVLEGKQAEALSKYIQESDGSRGPWNGSDNSRSHKFRIRLAGRTFLLPPRRSRLPENFDPPPTPVPLHSPFSPLSPSCDLYPDGMINHKWLQKHQELVPSVVACFYSLTADQTLATLHDNRIKADINGLRNAIAQSGYKCKLSVIFLAEETTQSLEGVYERLDNIRRGCALDTKAFFFIPPQDDLERAADNALSTIYTQAIEYYRDLGRHARKKRGRGYAPQPAVPPTSGTSQTLSLAGWNVRYDFKSGVFAEFRQEMDAASKSFEQAYEILMGTEVLDIVPSWSPRWNEARLLADILAVRILRCLFWNGQYSVAVRRWRSHRDRIADFVDGRGRGTNNYGWEAWESRWALVMVDLITKTDVLELYQDETTLFLEPEKSLVGERLYPWEHLHHPGYWYRIAAKHLSIRRAMAQRIPEDDRRPPEMSPASKVAHRAFTYENFMCPDPHEEFPLVGNGVDHSKMIVDVLLKARAQFETHKQFRLAAEITIECAREFAAAREWQKVFALLHPLWETTTFRSEDWLNIFEDLSWMLRTAAAETNRGDVVAAIDWELMNKKFTRRQDWHYDIAKSLDGISTQNTQPLIKVNDSLIDPFLSTSFAFKNDQGNAGHVCQAQLSIVSNAFPDSASLSLKHIRLAFNGGIRPVLIEHDASTAGTEASIQRTVVSAVALQEGLTAEEVSDAGPVPYLRGTGDLTIQPGQTRVFQLALHLREPGDARAVSAELVFQCANFTLEQMVKFPEDEPGGFWFHSATSRRHISRSHPTSIHVAPRPPKLEINSSNFLTQYYTNEAVDLQFEIVNAEDAEASVKIDAALTGETPQGFKLILNDDDGETAPAGETEAKISSLSLGNIPSKLSSKGAIRIDPTTLSTSYELTIKALYHLVSDPETPIVQTAVFKLNFVNPFEANYDLMPKLHPESWPSIFDSEGIHDLSDDGEAYAKARGLAQMWSLITRYASFAAEDLMVMDIDISIAPTKGVRTQTKKRAVLPDGGLQVKPKTIEEAHFDIEAQKLSLDDRDPASLDVTLLIRWKRLTSETVNTTSLPVPRLSIFGIEPRVLASVSYPEGGDSLVKLDICIENASNHFLTFGLAMEPSDEFAFSGAKQTTLNVLPVSRRDITYRLLPLVHGTWVKPGLVVRDKYFQKVLRVIPTEGMKLDKDGFMIWIPPLDDEFEEPSTDES
ncbi:uncharacterized protein E0L32_001438 [Thyridium curvatum]|uniref:Trafficking protein particle complex subunit 11 n=1 Tax=Thyridium curvatum TaxID=1093900 RepID=A0A507AZG4_9PEZI|nr:uncharacterized protein E0L32_001438 [Thyridium curvatum]TPX10241.1 hypothetical protein E0L32_001438 [Thyridium curvatum]